MTAFRIIEPHHKILEVDPANPPNGPTTPPLIGSADLFGGTREVLIAHEGTHYRLKITRQGKLILTK